jgi:hypothetical protein
MNAWTQESGEPVVEAIGLNGPYELEMTAQRK